MMQARFLGIVLLFSLSAVVVSTAEPVIPKTISLEYGIEASTEAAIMPVSNGSWTLVPCSNCQAHDYQITNDTKFFVGQSQVPLQDMNKFVRSGGPYFMMVYCKPQTNTVLRIVISPKTTATKK